MSIPKLTEQSTVEERVNRIKRSIGGISKMLKLTLRLDNENMEFVNRIKALHSTIDYMILKMGSEKLDESVKNSIELITISVKIMTRRIDDKLVIGEGGSIESYNTMIKALNNILINECK